MARRQRAYRSRRLLAPSLLAAVSAQAAAYLGYEATRPEPVPGLTIRLDGEGRGQILVTRVGDTSPLVRCVSPSAEAERIAALPPAEAVEETGKYLRELVTRLMLEPPDETSPELEAMIEADNRATLKRHARAGARGYLGFLALLPVLILGETAQLWHAAMLVGAIGLNVWLLVSAWSYRHVKHRTLRIALGNIALVTVVAKLTSPYLFAPAIAALAGLLVLREALSVQEVVALACVTAASIGVTLSGRRRRAVP